MGKMQISGRFVGDAYMRPVRFPQYIVISGRLRGRHICRPYKPIHYIHYNIRSRAGRAPPLPRKSLPLGGKVARNAPDEGEMSGSCNKPTCIIAIAAKLPPHQSPTVTASPKGEAIVRYDPYGNLPRAKQSPTGALLAHCGAPPCSIPRTETKKFLILR